MPLKKKIKGGGTMAQKLKKLAQERANEQERIKTLPKVVRSFWKFHWLNPHVYVRFKERVFALIESGRTFYSARTIITVLRFEYDLVTKSEDFKISNSHTPGYARLFAKDFPGYVDFFEYKQSEFDLDPVLTRNGK